MNEAEYNLLLLAVGKAVADGDQDNAGRKPKAVTALRSAANDNQVEWPLLPFPPGWHASC